MGGIFRKYFSTVSNVSTLGYTCGTFTYHFPTSLFDSLTDSTIGFASSLSLFVMLFETIIKTTITKHFVIVNMWLTLNSSSRKRKNMSRPDPMMT